MTTSPFFRLAASVSSSFHHCAAGVRSGFLRVRLQTLGLGLAAAFRNCFGKIGEEHGEPKPDRQLQDEATVLSAW